MSISFVLNLLGLLGFLLFIGVIVLSRMSTTQRRPIGRDIFLAVAGLAIGLVFSILGQSILVVGATQAAVIFNTLAGNFEPTRYGGTSLITPIIQQAAIYDIGQQSYTMVLASNPQDEENGVQDDDSIQGRTVDGQDVWVGVTLLYSIDPAQDKIVKFHTRWGNDYQTNFIRPTARSIVRDVISRFHASELYSEKRTEMEKTIKELVSESLANEGFILTDILVRGVRFSEQFTQAVEDKLDAEQQALQTAFQVQREQQLAEQVRVKARGEADAIILKAQADAEALRLVSAQIAANPALIQYLYVQNLSDNVSLLAFVPSNSPILFDASAMTEAAKANFVVPSVPQSTTPEATPAAGS